MTDEIWEVPKGELRETLTPYREMVRGRRRFLVSGSLDVIALAGIALISWRNG